MDTGATLLRSRIMLTGPLQSAVVATIVTSSFSWNGVDNSYWLAPALWYCSLLLAILGILISSQQIAVLDILGLPHPTGDIRKSEEESTRKNIKRFLPLMLSKDHLGQWQPRWKMVFLWQCGIMFLSYSVTSYLLGLTLYICSPLILGQWGTQAYVCFSPSARELLTSTERISLSWRCVRICLRIQFLRFLDIPLRGSGERLGTGRDANERQRPRITNAIGLIRTVQYR